MFSIYGSQLPGTLGILEFSHLKRRKMFFFFFCLHVILKETHKNKSQ